MVAMETQTAVGSQGRGGEVVKKIFSEEVAF